MSATVVPKADVRSYYGRPIVKEPVWKPEVPFYFFTGGLAGASAALAYGAQITGNEQLARRAWLNAMAGATASPVLLISDLGVPSRFFNMLRVFKVTSPMSVGSWILSAFGATTALATARSLGLVGRYAAAASPAAATLGLPMTTYTAVLVANSAIPAWSAVRHELPFVFAGSALASAGGAALLTTAPRHAAPARRAAIAGAVIEGAATQLMERRHPVLAEPYHEGTAGRLGNLAKACTVAGAAAVAFRGRERTGALAGGALLLAGGVLQRWMVFKAGFQSAQDPKYTVLSQTSSR
jgi:hypothetical protein